MNGKNMLINGFKYLVYPDGRIYGPSGKQLEPRKNEDGYLYVTVGDKRKKRSSMSVHRIVAKAFVPNPNGYEEVDHLDGNRANPNAANLEWVQHKENIARAYRKGSYKGRYNGEKNPKARLTEAIVRKLRQEYQSGVTIQELVDKYGYPWNTIGNAVKYITWKHID